jgi:uncharacterized membrane protein (UPF0127 family)
MNPPARAALPVAASRLGLLFSWAADKWRVFFSWAARRKKWILYGVGFVLAIFAVLAPTLFYQPPTAKLTADGRVISLEIVADDASRQKGLGSRDSLAADKGMLFVLDRSARECFWMKDMRFAIDLIFIDAAKRIVQITPRVTPQTYPKSFCADQTRYVIELAAGQSVRLHLHGGERLSF